MPEGFTVGANVGVSVEGELDGLLLGIIEGKELGMPDVVVESTTDADPGDVDGIEVLTDVSSRTICDFGGWVEIALSFSVETSSEASVELPMIRRVKKKTRILLLFILTRKGTQKLPQNLSKSASKNCPKPDPKNNKKWTSCGPQTGPKNP